MERYQGLHADDQISGGGSYVKEKGRGHEICNFSPYKGTLYGYVQPPGQMIDIDRIGADPSADSVSGISVVWTAPRPTEGTAVVGWYRDATVFRTYQKFGTTPPAQYENSIDGYWIAAPSKRAKLLGVDERTCEIPRQVKGGMGQANVWYADGAASAPIIKRVTSLMKSGKPPKHATKKGDNSKQDQERKAEVEKAAIRACCDYFEGLGYEVSSVEKDNVGWDLEAKSGKSTLRIEVKGLSGGAFSIELTPNEYLAFAKRSADYRLAVVLTALGVPSVNSCRYSKEQAAWIVEAQPGKNLTVQIRESASIKCI